MSTVVPAQTAQAPSTASIAVATAIIGALGGYFLGSAASIGIFGGIAKTPELHERRSVLDTGSDSEVDAEEESEDGELKGFSNDNEECKLVLVVRTDLGMTKGQCHRDELITGKIAAQASHATLANYKTLQRAAGKSPQIARLLQRWERHGQAKVAVQVKSEEELEVLHAQAISLGICANVIHDAGRTQIAAGSATVLGVGPAPKSVVDLVTGQLKLL